MTAEDFIIAEMRKGHSMSYALGEWSAIKSNASMAINAPALKQSFHRVGIDYNQWVRGYQFRAEAIQCTFAAERS